MRVLPKWSIQTKLIVLSTVSGVLALGLACTAFVANDLRLMHGAKVRQLQSQAEILGFNSSVALMMSDRSACEEFLKFLEQQPTIERACLYTADGRALAAYPKTSLHEFAARIPLIGRQGITSSDKVELLHPIMDQGTLVGGLHLRANLSDVNQQFQDYLRIAGLVMIGSVAVSFLFSLVIQRWISRPILNLAQTARRIEQDSDYSVRVKPTSDDEIGTLYESFNQMLDKIESSNAKLEDAHSTLEHRVVERTRQLQAEIDNRARIQGELERAKDAAEAASRAKSDFLANMSHEIRTPLNAILGFARLMRDGTDSEVERLDFLDTIHNSGQHLVTLINDILDLSKIEAGQMDYELIRWSPHAIIAETISVLRVRAQEKGLTLEYHWASQIPNTIATDPGRMRQLLLNLVGNAIKFTEQGGVRLVARLIAEEERLVIDIIDSGIGIPSPKLQSIFDPFTQADSSVTRRFGGTGLGLSICRHIATALGGGIAVQSDLGEGSVFTVSIGTGSLEGIRMLSEPDADILYRNRVEQPVKRRVLPPSRILVVDDGDTNRKLIRLVLLRAGVEVETAENGQQAVTSALNQHYDLILMDMQMPVMDGYTATRRLRSAGITVPIIALTAHAMRDDESRCLEAGCSGYLTKPIDPDRLIEALIQALTGGLASNQPDATDSQALPHARLRCSLPIEDAEFLEIVREFVGRLRGRVAEMQAAFVTLDYELLGQLTHWLKGTGGTAGFVPLTQASAQLELAIKRKDQAVIQSTLAELAELVDSIELPDSVPAKK